MLAWRQPSCLQQALSLGPPKLLFPLYADLDFCLPFGDGCTFVRSYAQLMIESLVVKVPFSLLDYIVREDLFG